MSRIVIVIDLWKIFFFAELQRETHVKYLGNCYLQMKRVGIT
jgi:hypothetical protein